MTNDGLKSLSFDVENELTNIAVTGQWQSAFVYDGLGRRRIERDYAWANGMWVQTNEVHYIYDGNLILQERDINNRVLVTYTRGRDLSGSIGGAGGIGGLLGRTDGNGSTFYHADCLGNVTALINSSNILVAQYLYSPFGQVVGKWGPYANLNEMQFSSMPRHSLSGFSMYLYRVYDAGLQRWVSRDPIGECGGVNLYRMNHNNPIDEIDPLGLDNMYGAVSGGTWNNNVPNVTLSMNPIVTPVYHPSIPVLTAAGEEPVSVPPGYTEYVPTGAFQLTTTYNGTDPNSVIMMIAAGYFLGDAAGEGLGAMGGAGFRLFTKCADFTKAAETGGNVGKTADKVLEWLGPDSKISKPPGGSDLVLRSADGTKQIRFDLTNPHGLDPHVNVETFEPRNLFPGDRKMIQTGNDHVFLKP
jgi:RHS repeat-associated protein